MRLDFYLTHDLYTLLTLLAKEGGESPQQLLMRLILKEDYERHMYYSPQFRSHQRRACQLRFCFLKEVDTPTLRTQAIKITRNLEL